MCSSRGMGGGLHIGPAYEDARTHFGLLSAFLWSTGQNLSSPNPPSPFRWPACPRRRGTSMCGASPAARAGELRSLHDSVSARLDGCRFQQPRSARRRTTGHLPSKRRRRGRDAGAGDGTTSAAEEEGMPGKRHSRRVRRRRELAAGNPAAEGFSVAGDGARRLRTHLCHAKEVLHGEVGASSCPSAPREEEGVHGLFSSGWKMEQLFMMPATSFQDSLLSIVRMVMLSCPEDKTTSLNHLHSQVMRALACWESSF